MGRFFPAAVPAAVFLLLHVNQPVCRFSSAFLNRPEPARRMWTMPSLPDLRAVITSKGFKLKITVFWCSMLRVWIQTNSQTAASFLSEWLEVSFIHPDTEWRILTINCLSDTQHEVISSPQKLLQNKTHLLLSEAWTQHLVLSRVETIKYIK